MRAWARWPWWMRLLSGAVVLLTLLVSTLAVFVVWCRQKECWYHEQIVKLNPGDSPARVEALMGRPDVVERDSQRMCSGFWWGGKKLSEAAPCVAKQYEYRIPPGLWLSNRVFLWIWVSPQTWVVSFDEDDRAVSVRHLDLFRP